MSSLKKKLLKIILILSTDFCSRRAVTGILCALLGFSCCPCFYLLLEYGFIIWGCCVTVLLPTSVFLSHFFNYCLLFMPFAICEWKQKPRHERNWQYRLSYKSVTSFSHLLQTLLSSYVFYLVTVIYLICVYSCKKPNHLGTLRVIK